MTAPAVSGESARVRAQLSQEPKPLRVIAAWTGLPRRTCEEAVQALRHNGVPICSGPEGVWIARSADELKASNERLRHRLKSQYATLRAQQNAERLLRGIDQLTLPTGTEG